MKMIDYFGDSFKPIEMKVVTTHKYGELTTRCEWGEGHKAAAINAINEHDKMTARINELESFVESLQLDVSDEVRRCELMGREW